MLLWVVFINILYLVYVCMISGVIIKNMLQYSLNKNNRINHGKFNHIQLLQ